MKRISSSIVENKSIENVTERAATFYKKLKGDNGESPISLSYLASKYSIPKSTIHRAVDAVENGRQVGKRGRQISINTIISETVIKWIEKMKNMLLPPSVSDIKVKIEDEIRKKNTETVKEKSHISRRTVTRF